MGRDLLANDPVFADKIFSLDNLFTSFGKISILDLFRDADQPAVDLSENSHLLTFCYQVALVESLANRDIHPAAVVGHSSGEVAAAHCAGVLSEQDAVQLVLAHCQLIKAVAGQGEMLFAAITEDQACALIEQCQGAEIAVFNSHDSVVFSGDNQVVRQLETKLEEDGCFYRPLRTSIAFHSAILDPYLPNFQQALTSLQPASARCHYFSALTGESFSGSWDANYWQEHIRRPVRFSHAVRAILREDPAAEFLEISPHATLTLALESDLSFHNAPARVFALMEKNCPEFQRILDLPSRLSQREPEMGNDQNIASAGTVQNLVEEELETLLGHKPQLDQQTSWFDLGVSSLQMVKLATRLSERLRQRVSPDMFFRNPQVSRFGGCLVGTTSPRKPSPRSKQSDRAPIAVIGMAFRFPPDLSSAEALTRFLATGTSAVSQAPQNRPWLQGERAGFLQHDLWGFDAGFFNVSPSEAELLDPQQRLLLEMSVHALESAMLAPQSLAGKDVGMFLGISCDDFKQLGYASPADTPYSATGNMFNTASGRISYFHDFRGPAVSIDTACSSSLVAVHQAIRALQQGECELALAGGVNLILSRRLFDAMRALGALSPQGECQSFSDEADGYVRGEGCALLVLKRLDEAEAAGDRILAILRGSAVNQDGRSSGMTAPNGVAQRDLILRALTDANCAPEQISMIETHGTGTPLGDPIEAAALGEIFADRHKEQPPVVLSALKSRLGHLEACAGVAGLIHAIFALNAEEVPGICHLGKPSRHIDWENLPLQVSPHPLPLTSQSPLRAGISAFGFSGTNAHLVVEQGGQPAPTTEDHEDIPCTLFAISAKSEQSLRELAASYRQQIASGKLQLDASMSLSQLLTRDHYPYRLAMVVNSQQTILKRLTEAAEGAGIKRLGKAPGKIAMLLPGQGTQYTGMGAQLYDSFAAFREAVDECDSLCAEQGYRLLDVLYPDSPASVRIDDSPYAQLCYLTFAWGAFHLWKSWGVVPDLLIGHSLGEYIAAALSGAIPLRDAIRLIIKRGKLTSSLPAQGRMATIFADHETVTRLLDDHPTLDIAVINGPLNVVVAGEESSLEQFCQQISRQGVETRLLAIHFASHCRLIEPALDAFEQFCQGIEYLPTQIPVLSNLNGTMITGETTFSAAYWRQHLRSPVNFADCFEAAVEQGCNSFVELGPSSVLNSIVRTQPNAAGASLLQTASRTQPDLQVIMESLRELYLRGSAVNWAEALTPFGARRISLPHYVFDHHHQYLPKEFVTMQSHSQPAPAQTDQPSTAASAPGILDCLIDIVHKITWKEPEDLDPQMNLFELGIDSLMLVQIRQQIEKSFQVSLQMGQFFEELDSLEKIASHLAVQQPKPSVSPVQQTESGPALVPEAAAGAQTGGQHQTGILDLFNNQMQAMRELFNRQLDTLGAPQTGCSENSRPMPSVAPEQGVERPPKFNFRSMRLTDDPLTTEQRSFISNFAVDFNRKTAHSKAQAVRYRNRLADWINSLGYKQSIKELVYPIVADRSQGAHFVDIDGNQYIDIAMGYGVTFLGHRPPAVIEAIRQQLERGIELGPQSRLAGEVAELAGELTGLPRVAFCNTGSEAVMVAIRLARAVTGRDKIVIFSNSYHGTFDSVLATRVEDRTWPTAIGIPQTMVEDILVLNYGSDEALEQIAEQADSLAAVLVEPVQSRNPALVPIEFTRRLRELTSHHDIALVFDETITGFRMHPGGAQALFGVQADIAIYGKAAGGGMPLSLVAGTNRYLDAIDGGSWSYQDNSHPSDEVTFFGGTYVKHPLALAAAKATLSIIKEQGEALQNRIGELLHRLTEGANAFFEAEQVPMRMIGYGSMFRFEGLGKFSLLLDPIEVDLFFHLLMDQGVYTWERRICFLSAAHNLQDIEQILTAIKESVHRLRNGGFPFRLSSSEKQTSSSNNTQLSSAQARLLVFAELADEKTLYNLPMAFIVDRELPGKELERQINQFLERHPALRAGFAVAEEGPRQEYRQGLDLRVQHLAAEGREIGEIVDAFVRPFDLACDLLVRAATSTLPDGRQLLLFDFHHMVADGITLNIFLNELSSLHSGCQLPEPGPHYQNFVANEETYRTSQNYNHDREFWLKFLADPPAPLALATDYPRPAVQSYRGNNLFFALEGDRAMRLKQLAASCRTSLFSLLLASYATLLSRLTGEERLAIGIPVDTRTDAYTRVAGMFANTLGLPVRVEKSESFRSFAKRVQKEFLQAFEHRNYPLEDLIRELQIPRDLGRNPLFDTMFIFENGQGRVFELQGEDASPISYNKQTAMFDLTLEVIDCGDQIACRFEYATALFKSETIELLRDRFLLLLDAVLTDSDSALSKVDLLLAQERELLTAVNHTAHPFPFEATVPELWRQRCELDRQRTVLICQDREFSADWLDEASNRIARSIGTIVDLQPDDRVALLMERSELAVAGLLGILKAGAAYVPISPDFPEQRRSAILQGSGAKALLVSEQQDDEWARQCGLPVVVAEQTRELDASPVAQSGLKADHLAYIMFTSGSTGAPKGVMISHRNLVSMTENLPQVYGIDANDLLLAVTTFTFDISVLEIFCCLLVGTRIVLATDDDNLAITPLASLMARHHVTAFQTTPSRLKLMLEMSGPAAVPKSLQTLLIGGEAFPLDLFEKLRHVETRVFNVYGPTEATIWSTSTLINGTQQPTIGRPLLNEQAYVLDQSLQPVAPGQVGELFIGGAGVGRGYLGLEELTASKFVCPDWTEGKILYATGDLARLRNDGEFECLGRSDDQIKLRGYRIELQEIENHLVKHPALQLAAVKTIQDPATAEVRDLAAYYTLQPKVQSPGHEALREHLAATLPAYMLPAYFTCIDKMPLNPSGKIDRKALPVPATVTGSLQDDSMSAETPLEEQLLQVFATVLGVTGLGVEDNFFTLGGDSIRALLVSARAKEAGLPVEVRMVFASPTVRKLAASLSTEESIAAQDSVPVAMTDPLKLGFCLDLNSSALPLAPLQEGMLFHALLDPESMSYVNQAVFTVEADLDPDRIRCCWQSLTERHAMLRTRLTIGKSAQPTQEVLEKHQALISVVDLTGDHDQQQETATLCRRELEQCRRLDHEPPVRILMLRLAEREWQLVWTFHHIL
ncbi:MAG: hypothetical protein C0614_07365, partial [Desulfuromonas sp.]